MVLIKLSTDSQNGFNSSEDLKNENFRNFGNQISSSHLRNTRRKLGTFNAFFGNL